MVTEIFISYSWWLLLPVIAIGLLYAGLLYIKNPLNKLSRLVSIILFLLRFFVVSFLVFLLLSPYVKSKKKFIEKPIIVIGHDNSSSIILSSDSTYYNTIFQDSIQSLTDNLSVNYDVDNYLFGDSIVESLYADYSYSLSNYSNFFSHINQNYSGLNVGAIILIGDGISNNGIDPLYAASDVSSPIFTVALGDTIQSRDSKIEDVRNNPIAYSGDIFPVEVVVSATKLIDNSTRVSLFKKDKIIAFEDIDISSDDFQIIVKFTVEEKNSGKQRYRIEVDPIVNEPIIDNNVSYIFVDILDSRKKVLVLANAPHPDVGAIKQSLLKNPNLEIEIRYITSFKEKVSAYDLVILYQLPSKNNSTKNILQTIVNDEIPVLFILGKQSNKTGFNKYFDGLNIISGVSTFTNAQFEKNSLFSMYSFDNKLANQLSSFPPLLVPMGNYQLSDGVDVFGWQRISDITTDFPLIAYNNKLGVRSGVISGEGIWQWRIQNYIKYNTSDAVDAFLNKSVMFLIADSDKRKFKILTKGEYDNNHDIELIAELYDESLKLFNSADVTLSLVNEDNEQFNYVFSPYNDYYRLNLNKLPVGIYTYFAKVNNTVSQYSDKGEFIVKEINNESRNLNA